jgi:hypothetical protein
MSVVLKGQRWLLRGVDEEEETKDFRILGDFSTFIDLWPWPEFDPASRRFTTIHLPHLQHH